MVTEQRSSVRQSLEQRRARNAWGCIEEIKGKGDKEEQEYRSLVRGFGAMILANGLGPALAFLYSKGKSDDKKGGDRSKTADNAHAKLLKHIAAWLECQKIAAPPPMPQTSNQSTPKSLEMAGGWLLAWVGHQDTTLAAYRRARAEALAILLWLKRFAEGALEDENVATPTSGEQDAAKS